MIAAALLVGAAGLASTASVSASDLAGLWRTPVDGGSIVRLTPCDADGICGRIVTSPHIRAAPDQRDVRNRDLAQPGPDAARSDDPEGAGDRSSPLGGRLVYNPEDGGAYRGMIELRPDGTLQLTGCVVRPLCKTQTWRRAATD
ncbi:DUF2147 domain-containing protein [Caulobacter sp. LARHSG274]